MAVDSPRTVTGLLGVLLIAAALFASPAVAAPATLVDDGFADFAAAPSSPTAWAVEPGAVRLRPAELSEAFEGTALPASLDAVLWSGTGSTVVGSGALTVDGARVHPADTETAPQVMEFRATFANAPFQHVGFATDFNAPPHALFSTGGGAVPLGFYARTDDGAGSVSNIPLTTTDPLVPHDYRIEWLANEVRFFVDGALVSTHVIAIGGAMRPAASDFTAGSGAIVIDHLGMGSYPASGVFESRVHDAGDTRAVWATLTASSAGTVEFATRSGNTAAPDGTWSDWQTVGAGGAIASPIARYIQYRATLSGASPDLDRVEIGYEIDTVAPEAVIDGVDVTGGTGSVRFSSAAPDVDRFECKLDAPGAAFATCASPKEFTGLASGSHTVLVRAVDEAGNVGPEDQRSFAVDVDAPSAVVDGVDVNGDSASVRFSSAALDVDRFECRLDVPGAAFATCASPKVFPGLAAGTYTVLVRAVDQTGNVGPVAQDQFTIASPPASGGGGNGGGDPSGGDPGPGIQPDATAPAVEVLTRSARASASGIVVLRVSCPVDEVRCRVTVRLKQGRKSSRAKTVSILGGKQAKVRLKLPKATRTLLLERQRLKLTALVTARDAAGNVDRSSSRLSLRPVSSTMG